MRVVDRPLVLKQGKEFEINGKTIMLYPISSLASALNRSTQTIRKWEVNEVIPKAAFHVAENRRMYSKGQIELIVKIAREEKIQQGESLENTNFSKRIFEKWVEVTKAELR